MSKAQTSNPAPPDAAKAGKRKQRRQAGAARAAAPARKLDRSIVLVGLMGVGKTTIGKRLASRLGLAFLDADSVIEEAAGRSIPEIFADFGEEEFRQGEEKVIARLLDEEPVSVIATGGGAFMREATRERILRQAHGVWLRADIETLVERTSRRNTRPLLAVNDPETVLRELAATRDPQYRLAPHHVWSDRLGVEGSVRAIIDAVLPTASRPATSKSKAKSKSKGRSKPGSKSGAKKQSKPNRKPTPKMRTD